MLHPEQQRGLQQPMQHDRHEQLRAVGEVPELVRQQPYLLPKCLLYPE
jgi:hypothetical protein